MNKTHFNQSTKAGLKPKFLSIFVTHMAIASVLAPILGAFTCDLLGAFNSVGYSSPVGEAFVFSIVATGLLSIVLIPFGLFTCLLNWFLSRRRLFSLQLWLGIWICLGLSLAIFISWGVQQGIERWMFSKPIGVTVGAAVGLATGAALRQVWKRSISS